MTFTFILLYSQILSLLCNVTLEYTSLSYPSKIRQKSSFFLRNKMGDEQIDI